MRLAIASSLVILGASVVIAAGAAANASVKLKCEPSGGDDSGSVTLTCKLVGNVPPGQIPSPPGGGGGGGGSPSQLPVPPSGGGGSVSQLPSPGGETPPEVTPPEETPPSETPPGEEPPSY